jgi:DNA end-binding protein Ku
MPHAIWKGNISFGLVQIPVGVYSAERKKDLNFVLLDRKTMAPVGYKRISKKTGSEVPWDDIVKGYEYEDDRYVLLGAEDFRKANPEATQTVEILGFVDARDIHPAYYEKPYYLQSVGKNKKGYALLREALRKTGKAGVARVVIHTREYMAVLIPMGKMLVLDLVRFADELKAVDEFDLPGEDLDALGVTPKEVEMAERLVEGMVGTWEPETYHDQYREDLLSFIRRKIEKGETELIEEALPEPKPVEGAEVIDLMALLKKSVQQADAVRNRRAGGA